MGGLVTLLSRVHYCRHSKHRDRLALPFELLRLQLSSGDFLFHLFIGLRDNPDLAPGGNATDTGCQVHSVYKVEPVSFTVVRSMMMT